MYESFKSFLTSKVKLSILAAALIFGLGNNIKAASLQSWARLFQEYVNSQGNEQEQQNQMRFNEILALSQALSQALSDAGQYDYIATSTEALNQVFMDEPMTMLATTATDLNNAVKILFFEDLNEELDRNRALIPTFRRPFNSVLEMINRNNFKEATYPGVQEYVGTAEPSRVVDSFAQLETNYQEMSSLINLIFDHRNRVLQAADNIHGIPTDLIGEAFRQRINKITRDVEGLILNTLRQAAAAEAEAAEAAEAEAAEAAEAAAAAEAEAAEAEATRAAAEAEAEAAAARRATAVEHEGLQTASAGDSSPTLAVASVSEGVAELYSREDKEARAALLAERDALVTAILTVTQGRKSTIVIAALNEAKQQQQQQQQRVFNKMKAASERAKVARAATPPQASAESEYAPTEAETNSGGVHADVPAPTTPAPARNTRRLRGDGGATISPTLGGQQAPSALPNGEWRSSSDLPQTQITSSRGQPGQRAGTTAVVESSQRAVTKAVGQSGQIASPSQKVMDLLATIKGTTTRDKKAAIDAIQKNGLSDDDILYLKKIFSVDSDFRTNKSLGSSYNDNFSRLLNRMN